jgi:hypothetical protein
MNVIWMMVQNEHFELSLVVIVGSLLMNHWLMLPYPFVLVNVCLIVEDLDYGLLYVDV